MDRQRRVAFLMRYEFRPLFGAESPLSPVEQSFLIEAMFAFDIDGTEPDFQDKPILLTVWKTMVKVKMQEDRNKYDATCEQNRQNILSRYKKRTTVYDRKQSNTDNDRDIDKDNDTDRDKNHHQYGEYI